MTRPEPPIVVKLGGETLAEQHATLEGVADAARTRPLVVVHGGGKRLSGWLDRLGVQSRFEDGRRVTDDETLSVAVAVLRGLVNAELVASLQRLGCAAVGISGVDGGLIQAERVPALGRVGRVVGAQPAILDELLRGGFVPVVAPIALDERGELCNVNADEVAAGLAAALRGRLVLLSDTDGVRDRDGQRIARLDAGGAEDADRGGHHLGRHDPEGPRRPRRGRGGRPGGRDRGRPERGSARARPGRPVVRDAPRGRVPQTDRGRPTASSLAVSPRMRGSAWLARRALSRCTSTACWACSRFSAWSKTTLRGPSITSASISSPRWAGRQCMTSASGEIADQRRRHPEARERPPALGGLVLLAHRCPDVGVDRVGAADGGDRVVDDLDARAVPPREVRRLGDDRAIRLVPARRGNHARESPTAAPASSSEWQTLLPSPTYASLRPRSEPRCSRSVSRSASAWHGCSSSESALTTGTLDAAASSVSPSWLSIRTTIASTYRDSVFAMSASGSRLPRPISLPESDVVWPPRRWMPISKETRVRRLCFSNSSATDRPARSAARPSPGASVLRTSACSRTSEIAPPSRSATDRRWGTSERSRGATGDLIREA